MDIHKLLDQLDEIIYISDPETNELLFLNRCGRNKFGALTPGVKCYEHLQVRKRPARSVRMGLCKTVKVTVSHGYGSIRPLAICCCMTVDRI